LERARFGPWGESVGLVPSLSSGRLLYYDKNLVLRTLRKGLLENRDSIIKLRQKLELLPSELNEYFQYMLDSVEPVYRMEACRTFAVAIKAATSTVGNTLSLSRYYILFGILEDQQYASLDADEIESSKRIRCRGSDLSQLTLADQMRGS
jgi:hypothetical protein